MSNKSGMEEWERVWSGSVGRGRGIDTQKTETGDKEGRSVVSWQLCAATTLAKDRKSGMER